MGVVNFGAPEKEVEFLQNTLGLEIFVEGGTYKGGTAKKKSNLFKKVYTIEKSELMFDIAKENLKDIPNIIMIKGDTREHFPQILNNEDNILFWLDAHWSGGDTYGEEDECPLIEELNIIFSYSKNYVILVDDARLFLATPPYPHKFQKWPLITDIIRTLPNGWEMVIYEDVIYLYPVKINNEFKSFLQKEIKNKENKQNVNTLVQKLFKKLRLC